MSSLETKLPRICLLVAAETSASVLYGLYDVLSTAGAIYPEMTTGEPGQQLLDVKIVAATADPIRCFGNVLVEPAAAIDALEETDVAIVCDMYCPPTDAPPHGRYGREIEWLKRMHAKGAIIASVCTGSLMLAESGLLDGLETAGHWAYREMFRTNYPNVKMQQDAILCLSAEHKRIVTAGAVNSWQELAIYFIMRLCGREQALRSTKIFLLSDHTGGQLPFAVTSPRAQKSDALIAACQVWIAENYACSNPVTQMAERAGLKSRTFGRRFRSATGYEPMNYVHAIRIEEAKQLLETSVATVEEIGHTVGYEDPTSFRRLFKREAGLTPAAYRRKFAGIIPSGLH
jgi:transcriptional regulator GlxA family with amidase domain